MARTPEEAMADAHDSWQASLMSLADDPGSFQKAERQIRAHTAWQASVDRVARKAP